MPFLIDRSSATPFCFALLWRHDIPESMIDCFHGCCIGDYEQESNRTHCFQLCESRPHFTNHLTSSSSNETNGTELKVLGSINFHFVAIYLRPHQRRKLVITYSLYGNDQRYFTNLPSVIATAQRIYPEWIIRFYVSIDTPLDIIRLLLSMKCEIILTIMKHQHLPNNFHGMFWRFFIANDESVERYLVRDVDSYVIQRERDAVLDWIREGKMFHVMRDHRNHNIEILGGLWGGLVNKTIFDIVKIYDSAVDFHRKDGKMKDQLFLRQYIWPIVKNRMTCHAAFTFYYFDNGQCHPFPTERKQNEYVGNSHALAE